MDIGITIDYLRPGAKYKSCRTYKELSDTWEDETVLPTEQELIDAEPAAIAAQNEKTVALFGRPRRGAKAQAWVNFLFIKDPTLYADQLSYWKAIRLAYRDRPWKV